MTHHFTPNPIVALYAETYWLAALEEGTELFHMQADAEEQSVIDAEIARAETVAFGEARGYYK